MPLRSGNRRSRLLWSLAMAFQFGCAARVKTPEAAAPPSEPLVVKKCVADLQIVEKTGTRMTFFVENHSEGYKDGAVQQIRLMFTAARCPIKVESPLGWTGAINARKGERACEVAWVSADKAGIPVGAKKEGFAATFRSGKIETPSWALFLDECAVSGTSRPAAK